MISFNCEQCGKSFRVPDSYAGRRAKCKACGNMVQVPEVALVAVEGAAQVEDRGSRMEDRTKSILNPPSAILSSAAPPRIPMRTRRLRADAEAMLSAFRDSPAISVDVVGGDPPEAYRVRYQIESLQRGPDGKPSPRSEHEIEIQLTSEYPRLSPKCKILTPIFHPNFDRAAICVGDHWTAGERLVDLVLRIGEMIAYQAYNIQSPLDAEAAMWADLNRGVLPTDARDLRPADFE